LKGKKEMSDTVDTTDTEGNESSAPKRSKWKLILGGIVFLLLSVGVGLGTFQVMKFKAKAEGLATGYAEAAVTAYQMDRYARPLPDRIFEVGPYRVETKTHGTPPQLHINVRDRYLNISHYALDRVFDVSGRPAPPPNEGQENTANNSR
jgi:hypothetical protein